MKKVFRTKLFLKTAKEEKEKYGIIDDADILNALTNWVLNYEGKTQEEIKDISLNEDWFEEID